MITDKRAREIAAQWHSPAPRDAQLSRLSHGMVITSWMDLAICVDALLREYPEDERLRELMGWVNLKLSRLACPACNGQDPYEDHTVPRGCMAGSSEGHDDGCPLGHPAHVMCRDARGQ